ncbi:hypothetical protein CDAR_172991 [Caerostris darwini]|uniref:Uncharacterized protein n=1 Tax=Caerostris darwini TaxID=1538125 RepID=A0AAV4TXY7_9ARAC|nr:hypothetical protein CDAR_172991 [Caerostris darwini]
MMKLLLIIGLSFVIDGVLAKKCDYSEFQECVSQVQDFADGYSFHITSAAELKDSFVLPRERTPYFNCLSLNKAVTFSHQVHGSGSSVAYLQYRRGNPCLPPRWRRHWNCAICAHNTAFVGRPLLNGYSVLLRKITNKSLCFPAAWKLLTITGMKI